MKRVFLSIFTLLIGMSTVAMAQAPCKTVKECETLRVNAHKLLTEQKASQAVHTSLDQQVDKQIKDLPWLWPQGNIIQGVQWSGVLDDKYDNLDLDKNKPPIKGIIQYSHATEACKAVGGTLPTLEDFAKFINNEKFLGLAGTKDQWFWSSSVYSNNPYAVYGFNGNHNNVDGYYRDNRSSVRCVGR